MSPRPADLNPENQRELAYAALRAADEDERHALLWWMAQHSPHAVLVGLVSVRWEAMHPDGWDQGDYTPPQ